MEQNEALKEIFSQRNTKHTKSVAFRTWKLRYKQGKLSEKLQIRILTMFGYKVVSAAIWAKNA